jgi:hypothetical protein
VASLDDMVTIGNSLNKNISQLILALNQANSNLVNAIDGQFPNWTGVPATSTSPGVPGQVAYSTSFLFICVATNTWRRVALSTF